MTGAQADLFKTSAAPERPVYTPEITAMIRGKLYQALDRVRTADMIPWDAKMELVHIENYVRGNMGILPPDEAATLWTEFDAHVERLYAVLNEGKDPDLGD